VTANNVANAQTEGFKKSRTILDEGATGGVRATIEKVNTSGSFVAKETDQGFNVVEQSNVDLGKEMVDLISERRFFEANIGALNIQKTTIGNLLDLVG